MGKFINCRTDYGFKFVFGCEESQQVLIGFLNETLKSEPGFSPIVEIDYNNKEMAKIKKENRGIVYDILCTSQDGKQFIVEMQNREQSSFIDRTVFYASRAVYEQGMTGDFWNFNYKPIYVISILNFNLERLEGKLRTDALLCDISTHKPITDKLRLEGI